MRKQATGWFPGVLPIVLLLLVSTAATAQEPHGLRRQPTRRSLYLSKDPMDEVPEVFVAARTVTTLRFETPCDPSQTKLLGWEGRFEPLLVGGGSVVIFPLQDLAPDDRFLLLVTLTDGTELPFTVAAGRGRVDGQVDVFPDPKSSEATRVELEEKRAENSSLHARINRLQQEETSVDHALATLLANNQVALIPYFSLEEKWRFEEPGVEVEMSIYLPRAKEAGRRVAVVFQVANLEPVRPWKLQNARLVDAATLEQKPFALRMAPSVLAPGATGRIAVVTELPPFDSIKDGDRLALEIFRDGGLRQGYLELDLASLASRYRRRLRGDAPARKTP